MLSFGLITRLRSGVREVVVLDAGAAVIDITPTEPMVNYNNTWLEPGRNDEPSR